MKKTIERFENYCVCSDGRVFNVRTGRLLKPFPDTAGYMMVSLRNLNGKKEYFRVHRLVAENFLTKVDGLNEVNHLDKDKSNNDVNNLEWCDRFMNMEHALSKTYSLLSPSGESVNVYNLTKFCRDMGLSQGSLSLVVSGKRKQHKGWRLSNG